MSDDLVKRLRSVDISWNEAGEYCAEAADLIEVLDKACKEWADVSQRNYQRAKAAEAKLAKAVEALGEIATDEHPLGWIAIAALKELTGDKPVTKEDAAKRIEELEAALEWLIAGAETVLEEWDRGDEAAFREAIEEMRSDVEEAKGTIND
jgi:ElaB/YqjD/DUF883 family membrane-anchored ribosome-binding protein